MTATSTKKGKIIAAVCFVVVVIGLAFFLFSGDNFDVLKEIFSTSATKEQVQNSIEKLGIRAYIVVLIISMLQVVLTFVPAEPLHVISGISFGLWKGMAVCLIGILIGNTIVYLLYKIYGARLTDYFAANVDFDFSSAGASNRLALIVIILYCLPAIPYGIICFFAASMGMKYHKYIFITGIGAIPSLFLDVGLGHLTMSTSWTISIIVFVVIIILLILMCKYKTQIFAKVNEFVRRSREKAQNKVGKYNPFVYWCASSLVLATIRSKVKIKLKNNVGKLSKPCIVLSNHGSFFDFVYSGKLLYKEQPHFIVARMYFHHKWLRFILERTGAFPKSMYSTDIDNVKNCLKVMSGGGVLAMMPEARLSTIGRFEDIQDATYKFIQKVNVPVYTIKINGGYLAKPKWGNKIRKGAVVEAELNQLFGDGESQTISLAEVKARVDEALTFNEWEWLDNHPEIRYKTKTIAEGLENVLIVCPKCGSKYSLTTSRNHIACEHCDLSVDMDNRYALHGVEFKNIAEWYDWQCDVFRKELKKKKFALESEVELRHLSENGKRCTRYAGKGVCTLDREGLKYVGTQDGTKIEKFFPLENIHRILFGAGEDFEIYDGKELYYFVPENKRSSVAWYIVSGLLKEKD
ncbi:MAG: hypothetical protein E7354_04395 [Clostridiales bacterium]|nr:hypothetical protein [Clostridiales bacterium]